MGALSYKASYVAYTHSFARPVIALMVSKLYANVDGETVSDGSLFSLKDTLELLSRLE